jgi:low affinity Fe/Cu permease
MKRKAKKKKSKLSAFFDKMATSITKAAGKPAAFLIAVLIIIIWAAAGPVFHYSDTWQLVINTSTTIITFLMVFVIQQTQNKDTVALHLKLNELISSSCDASNNLVNIEDLTEEELEVLKKFYIKLSQLSKKEEDIHSSHSLDEAAAKHQEKIVANNKD